MHLMTDSLGHHEIVDDQDVVRVRGNAQSDISFVSDPIGNADSYLKKWRYCQAKADQGDQSAQEALSSMRRTRSDISRLAAQGDKQAMIFMYRLGGKTLFNPDDNNPEAYKKWAATHQLF
jgi:hypothetical protein